MTTEAGDRLRTPRLELAPLKRADWEAMRDSLVLDREVMRFWHAYTRPGLGDDDRRALAERDFWDWFEAARVRGLTVWAVHVAVGDDAARAARPPDDAARPRPPVGWVGLLPPDQGRRSGEPELAYMLAARTHGRGYATEAARAVVEDAWARYGLDRMAAIVDRPNRASRRVVEKLGFVVEHGYVGSDGQPYVRYVLTRPGETGITPTGAGSARARRGGAPAPGGRPRGGCG